MTQVYSVIKENVSSSDEVVNGYAQSVIMGNER